MNTVQQTASESLSTPRTVLSSVTNNTPLTRVSLAFVERRINLYLRFGHPVREIRVVHRTTIKGTVAMGRVYEDGANAEAAE